MLRVRLKTWATVFIANAAIILAPGASGHVNPIVGIQAECTLANPLLALTPVVQAGKPEQALNYLVRVINTNAATCPKATFNLSHRLPAFFQGEIRPQTLEIMSGEIGMATFTVTSPINALPGDFTIRAIATNAANTSYTGTVGGIWRLE